MGELIDIRYRLHQANSRRIAEMVLDIMDLSPKGNDLEDILTNPLTNTSNDTVILIFIDYCFPPPRLMKVMKPGKFVDSVIEEILIKGKNFPF